MSLSCTFVKTMKLSSKMIIKGRSPTMRHVPRTHRVALDWLFDSINLEPKIQIKYVDTKNPLADILIKRSFSRDEWKTVGSESRAPCQKEVKRRLQMKGLRWQSRNQQFRQRRDRETSHLGVTQPVESEKLFTRFGVSSQFGECR